MSGPSVRVTFRAWKQATLERLERQYLARALAKHHGNITHTALALGLHRSTLQRLLRRRLGVAP